MTKILYIEDNPQNMRLVRKMLKSGGYTMIEAMDGLSGLEIAMQEKPDLILMDINLPDIDGMEATSRLKADPQMSHIPIIALTANAMHGDRERFLAAGCDGYLAKPISKNELLNSVAFYLENDTEDEQAKETSTKETSAEKTSTREISAEETSVKETDPQKTSTQEVTVRRASVRETSVKKTNATEADVKETDNKKTEEIKGASPQSRPA